MGKKKTPTVLAASPSTPKIYEAVLAANGVVKRGKLISQGQAEVRRRAGFDVVVCGDELKENRRTAFLIETSANGTVKRCPPHPNAGPRSLPHFQPDPRPPEGHTFYETPNRKAL
jgi:hypothetical protein